MPQKKLRMIRIALIALAVTTLCLGVLRRENAVVLRKAVNICLECIGIG